jgi:protein-tyrosine kinase
MGRVYKALLKADRVVDGRGTIGCAAAESAATQASHSFSYAGIASEFAPPLPEDSDWRIGPEAASIASEEFGLMSGPEPLNSPIVRPDEIDQIAPVPKQQEQALVFREPSRCVSLSPARVAPHLAAINETNLLVTERYRTLAVRMLNQSEHRKLKTVVITSAERREGKSTVSASLAWSLAKRPARRVLLIDAHLKAPSLSNLFGISTSYGWLRLVQNKASLADALIRIDPNGLYLTTPEAQKAGAARPDLLIDSRFSLNFEDLLARFEAIFDFILIDSPPLLESSDAERLSAISDGVVMVVRAGHTDHARVTEALTLVPAESRLGIVLNESDVEYGRDQKFSKRSSGELFNR